MASIRVIGRTHAPVFNLEHYFGNLNILAFVRFSLLPLPPAPALRLDNMARGRRFVQGRWIIYDSELLPDCMTINQPPQVDASTPDALFVDSTPVTGRHAARQRTRSWDRYVGRHGNVKSE